MAIAALNPVEGRIRSIRRVSRSQTGVIFRVTVQRTLYDVTLVPAFPGLPGTPWETTLVRLVRTAQAS
jgi:hypothetical protein